MEHYFSARQKSLFKKKEISVRLLGNELTFVTGSGVFSIGKVDRGSLLLIESCSVQNKWKVLDYGCGWGVVGIAIAKAFSCSVEMIDLNKRALQLSTLNLKVNRLDNAKVVSDPGMDYDLVLINPPQKAGKGVCFSMIDNIFRLLKKGGHIHLVARHQKGGKMLRQKMEEVFGNVSDLAKGSGFRVYVSKKS